MAPPGFSSHPRKFSTARRSRYPSSKGLLSESFAPFFRLVKTRTVVGICYLDTMGARLRAGGAILLPMSEKKKGIKRVEDDVKMAGKKAEMDLEKGGRAIKNAGKKLRKKL